MNLLELLTPFKESDATSFTIDAVQVSVSAPEKLPREGGQPLATGGESLVAYLKERRKVSFHARSFVAETEHGAFTVSQRLGSYGGERRGSAFALIRFNVHRLLRERLASSGALYDKRLPAKWTGENYIDPGWVRSGFDLHEEGLRELWTAIQTAADLYRETVCSFFGIELESSDVTVRISQIELTWDRPCVVARHAPTSFWKGWVDAFRAPGIGGAGDDPTAPDLVTATPRSLPQLGPGERVLRATSAKGDNSKLYAKTGGILRFEIELTKARMKRVLGRGLDHGSLPGIARDLERLAKARFSRLLRAQESLVARRILDFGALFGMFANAGEPHKVGPILEAFLARRQFHNVGGAYRRELKRLDAIGAVEYLGGGLYTASALLTPTFRWLEILARQAAVR